MSPYRVRMSCRKRKRILMLATFLSLVCPNTLHFDVNAHHHPKYSFCGTDTCHIELMIENLREQKTRVYGIMDSFPSFYTRMVGIEAKVVCTKKTIRCCTAYFRCHGENLRSFCTRECRKIKSQARENCIHIT